MQATTNEIKKIGPADEDGADPTARGLGGKKARRTDSRTRDGRESSEPRAKMLRMENPKAKIARP